MLLNSVKLDVQTAGIPGWSILLSLDFHVLNGSGYDAKNSLFNNDHSGEWRGWIVIEGFSVSLRLLSTPYKVFPEYTTEAVH